MCAVQGKDWSEFVVKDVVKDGKLITGQNPQVSTSSALVLFVVQYCHARLCDYIEIFLLTLFLRGLAVEPKAGRRGGSRLGGLKEANESDSDAKSFNGSLH